MPSLPRLSGRPISAEHQEAVARRLELLRAELAGVPSLHAVPDLPDPSDQGEPEAEFEAEPWWGPATRVPVPPDEPPHDPPGPAEPAPVPLPGRHASRRRRDLGAALVPATLRGRVAIGPAQLTVVAVLLCLGLAVTAFTVVRSRPQPVESVSTATTFTSTRDDAPLVELPVDPEAPASVPVVAGAPTAVTPSSSSTSTSTSVTVDVAGKVRRPGIAVLDPGARVVDAIAAAGGAKPGVDLTALNLARVLVDGEQIVVGIDPPPGVAASALGASGPAPPATEGAPTALVDLNAATEAQLDTLPEVGPVTAQSIIAWRQQHGGFTAVDELLEVDGIGEATLARIAPHVTV